MSDALGDFLRRDELANRAQRAAAGVAVARSDGINGDAAAQQAQLARRYNVSPEIVAANPKIFQQRSETDDFQYHTQRQPKLADFIGYDEHRAAMMKDDIGNSAQVADLFDEHGRDKGWDTALAAPNRFYNITQALSAPIRGAASFFNYLTDDSPQGFIPQVKAGRTDLTLGNVARSMGSGVLDIGSGLLGGVEAGTNLVAKYNPLSNAERYLFGTSEFDIAGNAFTKTRHSLEGWANELAPKATTTAGEGILSGVRSIPTSVGAFAVGTYFRSAKVAAVLMGGVVGGQSYGKGRDEGLGVEHAIGYGAIDAGIETLTEYLPEKYLIGHVGANSPFIKRFLGSMLREVPGEQAATILQDFNQWANIDASKGKTFQDYLNERPHAALTTLIATAVTTGAINTALSGTEYVANKLGKTLARAQAAEVTAPFLERMTELAKASKLAKRDAGTFSDFVKMAAEGSDATHVYVDAKELVNVLEQSGIRPEEVAKLTGKTIAELHQSAIRGDDIQIPIEQFAAQIAPVEALSSKLIPHLRINPEEMSAAQAKTFMQGAMDELTNEAEKHFTGMESADTARQSMDRVRESYIDQLSGAGRFTNDVNRSYATMIASFYASMGAKVGLNAEQMAERYPLRVQSESPVEPAKRTVRNMTDKQLGALSSVVIDAQEDEDGNVRVPLTDEEKATLRAHGIAVSDNGTLSYDAKEELLSERTRRVSGKGGMEPLSGGAQVPRTLTQRIVDRITGRSAVSQAPLQNLPERSPGPFLPARQAAQSYAKQAGIEYSPPARYALVDEGRAKRIAQAFDDMKHAPNDPAVRASYDAMIKETLAQWGAIKQTGLKVEFVEGEDPYNGNPMGAVRDVRENNHLWVFNTEDGYGQTNKLSDVEAEASKLGVELTVQEDEDNITLQWIKRPPRKKGRGGVVLQHLIDYADATGKTITLGVPDKKAQRKLGSYYESYGFERDDVNDDYDHIMTYYPDESKKQGITPAEEASNPMLAIVPGETWSGKPVRVNDVFRVVHDYFGHIKEGVGFRAAGEENAWRIHSAMYSPLARKAMTTETRGQNSWLNYGPHGEANRTAKVGDTVFAEQKIGLMPDWVSEEGAHDDSMQGVLQQATMLRAERAAWSDERLDGLIREYGYSFNNESKGWAVMMSPDQFLGLTLSEKGRKQIAEGVTNPANDYEGGVINPERLAAAGPIMLSVHLAQEPSDLQKSMGVVALDNRISGHEGRHRMTMLKAAGVEQVPVLLIPREGKVKAPLASLELAPQRSRSDQLATGDTRTTISNAIPLNHQYRDQLRAMTRGTEPVVLFQSATFYSALERAISTSTTNKASAEQWIATLKKAPGVKQEELEWSGMLDFLADHEGPIERTQLVELMQNGGIKTDEVLLGAALTDDELSDATAYSLRNQFNDRVDDDEFHDHFVEELADGAGWVVYGPRASEDEKYSNADDAWGAATEYNDADREDAFSDFAANHWDGAERTQQAKHDEENGPQFKSWSSDPSNETYRELLITLPLGEGKNPSRAPSTHWDTEGVVAHARFMDKVDADGNKVLFIEEVQSDWHQKGRDEGYETKVDPAIAEPLRQRVEAFDTKIMELGANTLRNAHEAGVWQQGSELVVPTTELLMRAAVQRLAVQFQSTIGDEDLSYSDQLVEQIGQFQSVLAERSLAARELLVAEGAADRGIPNAPFKSSWPALVMKRMIRYAADHGYSRIAWTTGEQQAERYSLGAAVGSIEIERSPENSVARRDGAYRVSLGNGEAERTLVENQMAERGGFGLRMTEAQMKAAFGADITTRLIEGAEAAPLSGEMGGMGNDLAQALPFRLTGQDNLRVGGEGMKAFYDRNLVNITNDLIKRHGAKVGTIGVVDDADAEKQKRAAEGADFLDRMLAEMQAGQRQPPMGMSLEDAIASSIRERDQKKEIASYPAGQPQPGFEITDALTNAAKSGFALFQNTGSPRGQIAFGGDITQEPSVITLLRGADLSTFLHESGHFFLEVLTDMSGRADAPAGVLGDMKALLDFFGVESLTKWQEMSIEERRDHHEKFARGFEAYLFEGKAPSIEMRNLFTRFRNWLKNVYRSLSKLNVTLTDEVRGVFDRMLASEEAIAEAQTDLELTPFFDMKPEGMSDVDWTEYQSLGQQATSEAESQLERRSLGDMRYAGKAAAIELKRLQKEVAGQRAAMRDEVTQDLIRQPVYRAINWLRTGQIDGEDVEGPHKLNTPDVRAILQLGDAPIPDSLKGFTSSKDGVNPEQVAELFGYGSGDQMIKDMLFASPLDQAVEAETDSRMRERYGELNSPEALKAAVEAAVHNTVRGRFVATELAALENAPGKVRALTTAAKRIADSMIAQLKIRDVRPAQYEAAERRAAKDAQKAGTAKLAEVAAAKRNQLLQFHAAKAAHAAIEEIDKARKYLGKFNKQGTRDAIDPGYRDQIDAILEKLDLRTGISNKEAERRKSLADWIKQQEDMGFEPAFDAEMIDAIGRTPFRELYVEEMRGIVDAVRNIEHLGRVTKKLMTAIDKASLAQAADEVAATVHENAFKTHKAIIGSKTWFEHIKSGLDDFLGMHRKFAMIARLMDGDKDGGPLWERFVRGMNASGDAEVSMNRDATIALAELFKPLKDTMKRTFIPEINASLRLEDRLMIALNWGNATSKQRVVDGDKWTDEQVGAILAPLTAEHWDFVEGIWRYLDSFRPLVGAKQRRVTGVEPKWVEAEPFQIEVNGELRLISGGYFPIKYDPDRSTKAEADNDAEIAKGIMRGAYTSATTRRGYIKERVDSVKNRPVRKDFGVIFQHVSEVVHDLTHHEWLIDANRLLKSSAVDNAIREAYGPATLRWMRKALEDIAAGDLGAHNALERSVNYLRQGATIAGLGWNLTTALFQPLGLAQSMVRIGPQWVGKGIFEIFSNPLKMNAKMQWIYTRSAFMRSRTDTMQREINEIRNKIAPRSPMRKSLDAVIPQPLTDAVGASYFYLIGKMQLIADVPTWIGQYEKSLAAGRDEDTAVALADQAVLDAQGGGQTKDLAGVQRGNVWLKLWTNFYSYFSVTQNLMANRVGKLRRVGMRDLPFFAVDTLLLTAVPATMSVLLKAALAAAGGGEPPDDDLAKKIAQENLNTWLGMFIGLRETQALVSDNQSYNGPAGARVISEAKKLAEQAKQGEIDEAFLRALNSTAGVLLHYPAGQVDRTVRGLEAMSDGKAGAGAAIVGPPPKKH